MNCRMILAGMGLLFVVGCSTEHRVYHLSVENQMSQPVTVWVVKENGPVEEGWMTPEQVAVANQMDDEKLPDKVIPPGKTLVSPGPITGVFDKVRGRALLRVYMGTPTLTEMLAISHGSLGRLDLVLQPGVNHYVLHDDTGLMSAAKAITTQPSER